MKQQQKPPLDARMALWKKMSEAQFQAQIIALAKRLGWLCYHTWNSQNSASGFPDLVLVRERVLFVELKRQVGGVFSFAQLTWLDRLDQCSGVETYRWKPENIDEAERILRRVA